MRKLAVLSTIIFMFFLVIALPTLGQQQEESSQAQEQLENARPNWEGMSAVEREKLRSEARGRAVFRGTALKNQLQIIEAIEKQVAQLKAAVEGIIQSRTQMQNATEEERPKYRKEIVKSTQTRQQTISAIEQELEKLKFTGQRQRISEPQVDIKELQEIQQLAVKEKATETAKKLQNFIAKYQQIQTQSQNIQQRLRENQPERARDLRSQRSEVQEAQ